MKLPLTLLVITLNEERNIERCIASVPFASEVLVIDSGSTDRTEEIAKKTSAGQNFRCLQKAWQGFGPQKKWGTEQATNDWILSLDADEALSPELAAEIQKKFAQLDPSVAYKLPRKSFHLNRWIHHGGWYPDHQLRLYNRTQFNWSVSQIHEKVVALASGKGRTECLSQDLRHWVFASLAEQIETNNRYSGLLAKSDFEAGKRFSILRLIFKPWSKFFECYLVKLGCLDGLPGFIIAVGAGYSIFLRQAKLWEIERGKAS